MFLLNIVLRWWVAGVAFLAFPVLAQLQLPKTQGQTRPVQPQPVLGQPQAPAPPSSSQPSPAQPRRIVTVDRIVAVVNEEVITRSELNERVAHAVGQLARSGTPAPPREDLERQLLDRMISDRVMLQYARDSGVRVDDTELDRSIERIAQDNQMVVAQLRMALQKDGIPFDKFRRDIRSEIIMARLREREVNDRITVTDSEVDSMLASGQDAAVADEFNLSHILVRVPDNASPDQIQARQARANQALAQLKGGTDFRQIAASFSDAPDALQGGVLGWREGGKLPVLFTDALRAMKPGDLSGVLRSPNGFHVLKLNERRTQQQAVVVQQTRARHILIKVNEALSESEGRVRLANLRERLVNKGDFAQLARANSEDTSASRGGELGWLSAGDTVPEFERAMDGLKIGDISQPVRSPFGWHLIQVLERRSADVTSEKKRLAARMALRERKSEESFQEWLRQARARSYIELRLDER